MLFPYLKPATPTRLGAEPAPQVVGVGRTQAQYVRVPRRRRAAFLALRTRESNPILWITELRDVVLPFGGAYE